MKKRKVFDYYEEPYRDPEFIASLEGRTVRILSEYLSPMTRLERSKINSTILFLGSSKADPSDPNSPLYRYYWEAEELSYLLTRWSLSLKKSAGREFVICTGAGPGIMEAANRGAQRAGGKSLGMNISLPQSQNPNPFITSSLIFTFHYFFMRKFWLLYKAKAVIIFPGGYGTLDEFFETATLIQTSKISRKEITLILYGEEYWRKIIDFNQLVKMKAICPEDLHIFHFCSSPKESFDYLKRKLKPHLK